MGLLHIIINTIWFIVIGLFCIGLPLMCWVGIVTDKLNEHNLLLKCESKRCGKFFRKYQYNEYCPYCSCIRVDKVSEIYKWMAFHPDFKKHSWKQYKQFKKLGKIIKNDAYERRSKEMFIKHWEKKVEDKYEI